ncbi:hypothetical protein Tco_1507858 [Tanacetum coccineum]
MSTPPTSVMSRTRHLIPYIILSDSEDEDTTTFNVSAPLSPDHMPDSFGYSPDSDMDSKPTKDDSSNEDLTETAESPLPPLPLLLSLPSVMLPPRSGYQQKDRKPSQNDKTDMEWKRTVQNQAKGPKMSKSESILMNSSQTQVGTEEYYWTQS